MKKAHKNTTTIVRARTASIPQSVESFGKVLIPREAFGKAPSGESKRDKAKRLRIAGKSYVNSKGECVPGKNIGPDCNCRLQCYKKIKEDKRQEIFKAFYSLKSYDEQGSYLYGLIMKQNVQRKRALVTDGKFTTYKYHIRCNGKLIQVCKNAFANIHAVSFKKIRNLCEKLDHDVLYPYDQRGKHDNRPSKIPMEVVECIKNFILCVLQSDQLVEFVRRDKVNCQYEINVSQLYKQYMQVYEPGAFNSSGKFDSNYTRRVKTWFFKKVFDEEIIVDSAKLKEVMQMAGSSTVCVAGTSVRPSANLETVTNISSSSQAATSTSDNKKTKKYPLPAFLAGFESQLQTVEIIPL